MVIVCKINADDQFCVEAKHVEIDLSNNEKFVYTFWNEEPINGFYDFAALDLLYISLFIFAADKKFLRQDTFDCWSRDYELYIPVIELEKWNSNKKLVEKMLSFLSGDRWKVYFRKRELTEKEKDRQKSMTVLGKSNKNKYKIQKICMLSGGLDSFVGAIDLLESQPDGKVLFVSHYGGGKGTKEYQDLLIESLKKTYGLTEFSFRQFYASPKHPKNTSTEDTTRTRSLMFFAHAIALASTVDESIELIIPENGLISLNIPMTYSRIGTSSTRTTHPHYMELFQRLLDNLGLRVKMKNPYQFYTKGEMLLNCKNKRLLSKELKNTMSCSHPDQGRHLKEKSTRHCGYCLPCVIRRASIKRAGFIDESHYYDPTFDKGKTANMNLNSYKLGMKKFSEKHSFMTIQQAGPIVQDIKKYSDIYVRGMKELKEYLQEV